MRNMSFALTTKQVREGTKTVTRRDGWWFLKPGDRIMAVEKAMGLKKGETIKKIREIVVVKTRPESLEALRTEPYGSTEAALEGFPGETGADFINFFKENSKPVDEERPLNRIEFKYVKP